MSDEPPMLEMKEGTDPFLRYENLETIGEGGFGVIYKVREKSTGNIFAAKVVSIGDISSEEDRLAKKVEIQNELELISIFNHPNIIKCFDSCFYNSKIYIFLECCEAGSVFDIIRVIKRKLNEEEISFIVSAMVEALGYLHKQNPIVYHRDIKAGNILISDVGNILLTDFGVSAEMNKSTRKEVTGSPYWMAPEVLRGQTYGFVILFLFCNILTNSYFSLDLDELADVWSLGITIIEMVEGKPPLTEKNTLKAMYLITRRKPPTLKHPERYSQNLSDFIASCLTKDPNKRPSSSKLLFHPFIHKIFTQRKQKVKVMKNLVKEVFDEFAAYGGRKAYFEKKDEISVQKAMREDKEEEEEEYEEDGEVEFDEMWDEEEESEDEDDDDDDDDDDSSSDADDYEKSKIFSRRNVKANNNNNNNNNISNAKEEEEQTYLADSDDDEEEFDDEVKVGRLELSMSKKNLFESIDFQKMKQLQQQGGRGGREIENIRKRNIIMGGKNKKMSPILPSKSNRPSSLAISNGKKRMMKMKKMKKGRKVMLLKKKRKGVVGISKFYRVMIWVNFLSWLGGLVFLFGPPSWFGIPTTNGTPGETVRMKFSRLFGLFHVVMGVSGLPFIRNYYWGSLLELAVQRTLLGVSFLGVFLLMTYLSQNNTEPEKEEGFIEKKLKGLLGGGGGSSEKDTEKVSLETVILLGFASLNVILGLVFWVMFILRRRRTRNKMK